MIGVESGLLPVDHRDLRLVKIAGTPTAQSRWPHFGRREIMDKPVKDLLDNLGSTDDRIRFSALQSILKLTESQVEWVYDVWDDLFEKLDHENSYQKSIAIMLLCNLAKSDKEDRLADSLDLLLAHTKDEKFITSRQCIQSIWKVATTSKRSREEVLAHLEMRYKECVEERHYNLIRQDIIQSLRHLYEEDNDDTLLTKAQELMLEEKEAKHRKKYEAILRAK
jgi:hypothetical protein